MGRVFRAAVGLASIVLTAGASRAQKPATSTLVARIAVDSSRVLLPGVELVITDLHRVTKSDLFGEVMVSNIPLGVHTVRVRAFGYAAAEARLLFQSESLSATFYLKRVPSTLETVRVSTTRVSPYLRQFEARRAMGIGRFLTEAQLDSAATPDFTTFVSTRFPGLRVVPLLGGERELASTRGSCGGTSCFSNMPCAVVVFLDGQNLHESADDIVRIWDLAGVEFYTGAQVPAEYRVSGSACGVLVLWSRRP